MRVRLIGAGTAFLPASIGLLLAFQFLDDPFQRLEARIPELAIPLKPARLFVQPARAELAGPYAPDLLGGDEAGLLEHADVLLHAGQGHVETAGQVRDRGVGTTELLQHAAPGNIR
jgi:hypothetical protein